MTGRYEIPASSLITESNVRSQDSVSSVQIQLGVFHMNMIDSVRKIQNKHCRINSLPDKMAGIEIDTQSGTVIKGFKKPLPKLSYRLPIDSIQPSVCPEGSRPYFAADGVTAP